MSDAPAGKAIQFKLEVPESQINGCYADFMSVWNSPHDFTLDFAVTGQPEDVNTNPVVVPARVVARIKIPLAMAQDVLQALATQVSQFEATVGQSIPRLQDKRPLFPPSPPSPPPEV